MSESSDKYRIKIKTTCPFDPAENGNFYLAEFPYYDKEPNRKNGIEFYLGLVEEGDKSNVYGIMKNGGMIIFAKAPDYILGKDRDIIVPSNKILQISKIIYVVKKFLKVKSTENSGTLETNLYPFIFGRRVREGYTGPKIFENVVKHFLSKDGGDEIVIKDSKGSEIEPGLDKKIVLVVDGEIKFEESKSSSFEKIFG